MAIRVYLVEDHPIMQKMLSDVLGMEPDFEVCGLAATVEEALAALSGQAVDLVLIDVSLGKLSGIDLVGALLKQRPGLRCLMYSGHSEAIYVEQALAAGAKGYVLKGSPAAELAQAIRQVTQGEVYLSASLQPG